MTSQVDPIEDVIEVHRIRGREAALQYIDEMERFSTEPNRLHSLRCERIRLLHDAARYDDAILAARAYLSDAPCKTAVFHDIGLAFYRKGDLQRAESELAQAPVEDEVNRYEPLILEAVFLRLFIRKQLGKPVSPRTITAFPNSYQQITERGQMHGLDALRSGARCQTY